MCVACGQFTGSSSSKTQRMGRPAFFQEEKFLNWTGTMTLGSINNPHLLIWSLVLHQRKHMCDGERPVWRVPAGGQVQLNGLAPHRCSTKLGSSPPNTRTRERVN